MKSILMIVLGLVLITFAIKGSGGNFIILILIAIGIYLGYNSGSKNDKND